ncbi:MAG: hypothetical protein KBC34_06115, partial [Phenylobacterium sp.]|nr:hypothetical protein [Phenylobacterium sp.]
RTVTVLGLTPQTQTARRLAARKDHRSTPTRQIQVLGLPSPARKGFGAGRGWTSTTTVIPSRAAYGPGAAAAACLCTGADARRDSPRPGGR